MSNPKQDAAARADKPPLDLLEYAADVEIAYVMRGGAEKYGMANYRNTPVSARGYAAAMKRHIGAWLNGEDLDPDDGRNHLAHVGANVHVVLAAMQAGTFVDDRHPETT